jgi:hypothetical protein
MPAIFSEYHRSLEDFLYVAQAESTRILTKAVGPERERQFIASFAEEDRIHHYISDFLDAVNFEVMDRTFKDRAHCSEGRVMVGYEARNNVESSVALEIYDLFRDWFSEGGAQPDQGFFANYGRETFMVRKKRGIYLLTPKNVIPIGQKPWQLYEL